MQGREQHDRGSTSSWEYLLTVERVGLLSHPQNAHATSSNARDGRDDTLPGN